MSSFESTTVEIYGAEVYLATDGRQWAALKRRLSWLGDKPTAAGQANFAVWEPKGGGINVPIMVLYIDAVNHSERELVDSCAHEAAHAASELFHHLGHTPSGTDEPTAYFIGWLTRWLWEHCRPLIKEDA